MEWQELVSDHPARFKILRCGRRTGKTFFIIIDSISLCLLYGEISIAYIGLSYGHAKDVVWADYMKLTKGMNVVTNLAELTITFPNGSRIRLYSWDSIDNMLGKKYHKVYGDECAVAKNLKTAWDNVIEPTLLDYHGEAWLTSMPRGKGQFKAIIDTSKSLDDWQDFHFTSYDNSSIPGITAELDKKRLEISPSVFAQQYLAEFTDLQGRIYTEFNRDDALGECPFEPKRYGLSIDFGYNAPCAIGLYAISSDENICLVAEVYRARMDELQRLQAIRELIEGYEIDIAIADSEDPLAIAQLNRELPFIVQPAVKGTGSVLEGINITKTMLHTKRLTILGKCVNTIDELEGYAWKVDKEGKETDQPIKENDHMLDNIRYMTTHINNKPKAYNLSDLGV
jgi:PBSX family phage terminase large subunit